MWDVALWVTIVVTAALACILTGLLAVASGMSKRTAQPAASQALSTAVSQPSSPLSQRQQSPAPSFSSSLPVAPPSFSFPSSAEESAFISALLQQAHASLAADRPMQALNLVLTAVRQQRGEEGVFDTLNAAREEFGLPAHANPIRQQREQQQQLQRQQQQEEAAAAMLLHDDDEKVDNLMSSLSLHRAFASYPVPPRSQQQPPRQEEDAVMEQEEEGQSSDDERATSILEEQGQSDVLDAALRDHATYRRCGRCGGVIARDRWRSHVSLWCDAANSSSGSSGGEHG